MVFALAGVDVGGVRAGEQPAEGPEVTQGLGLSPEGVGTTAG